MKHIELTCDSLAECYSRLKASDMITLSDLCHKAKVTIDIDLDSPFDASYIEIPDYSNKKKEQKFAEWSEEDKKLLNFWLDVIDRNDWRMDENFCKASREFINKLKSLRPQPKQEWSIEEVWGIHNCCLLINAVDDRYGKLFKDKCLHFLLNLRPQPHWKPSEEQMEALRMAVNKFAKTDVADSVRLSIMYDNLKKL